MTRKVQFGGRQFPLPSSRSVRIALGIGLVAGGLLGFLPVLGFWMIPLGLLVLSADIPLIRRWRRALQVKWEKWRRGDSHQNRRSRG
jgi:hypothetical protein